MLVIDDQTGGAWLLLVAPDPWLAPLRSFVLRSLVLRLLMCFRPACSPCWLSRAPGWLSGAGLGFTVSHAVSSLHCLSACVARWIVLLCSVASSTRPRSRTTCSAACCSSSLPRSWVSPSRPKCPRVQELFSSLAMVEPRLQRPRMAWLAEAAPRPSQCSLARFSLVTLLVLWPHHERRNAVLSVHLPLGSQEGAVRLSHTTPRSPMAKYVPLLDTLLSASYRSARPPPLFRFLCRRPSLPPVMRPPPGLPPAAQGAASSSAVTAVPLLQPVPGLPASALREATTPVPAQLARDRARRQRRKRAM